MDLTPNTRSQRDLDRDVVIDIAQRGDGWGRIARRMLQADEATASTRHAHQVSITGVWHNDSTAGVGIWCETCKKPLLVNGQSDVDDCTVDELIQSIKEHRHV